MARNILGIALILSNIATNFQVDTRGKDPSNLNNCIFITQRSDSYSTISAVVTPPLDSTRTT